MTVKRYEAVMLTDGMTESADGQFVTYSDYQKLVAENGALQAANTHAALCINAAMVEGLLEALAESSDDRLVDLVNRRLLHAYQEVDSPLTEEQLWQMGDAILLEQLKDGTNFIARQSEIIANQNQRISELESKTTDAAIAEIKFPLAAEVDAYRQFIKDLGIACSMTAPETDHLLNHYKAQGVDELARTLNSETIEGSSMVMVAKTFAANLRAGRKG